MDKSKIIKYLDSNFSNVSLVEMFCRGRHDMLNSTRCYLRDEKSLHLQGSVAGEAENAEKVTVNILTGGVDMGVKRDVYFIDDIEKIDLRKWIDNFETLIARNKWKEDIIQEFLIDLCRDSRIDKGMVSKNWEETKTYLLKLRFPKEIAVKNIYAVEDRKQEEFVTIKSFLDNIKGAVDIYALHFPSPQVVYERKLEELFFLGLGKATTDHLIILGKSKFKESYNELVRLEEAIIQKYNIPRSIISPEGVKFLRKWCRNHKVLGHTTKECKLNTNSKSFTEKGNEKSKQDKNFVDKQSSNGVKDDQDKIKKQGNNFKKFDELKEKKDNKDITNYLMVEPCNNIDYLIIPIIINNEHEGKGLLDSGSKMNFISQEYVEKLKLRTKEERDITITCGNGTTTKSNRVAICKICLEGTRNEVNCEFFVVKDLPNDLIFGQEFLFRNEIVLDYQRKRIIWNDSYVTMGSDKKNAEVLEQLFYEKMLFLQHSGLEERIKQYEALSKKFEFIKVSPIELKFSERVTLKQGIYYSVSRNMRKEAEEEVCRLLKSGIIEESVESFSSPAFFLKKKNGNLRLVVDYKELNKYIIDDLNVIPKLEDIVYEVEEEAIITKIDLTDGFNQLLLANDSKKFTTFSVLGRKYQYKRLPFGIKIGPKVFQGYMNEILKDLSNVSVYIDDIVISTITEKEHVETLIKVLDRLERYEVKINFKKSVFGVRDVEILGNRITEGRIYPNIDSLQKLERLKEIKSKKELQKVIGILNWYRKFIPNLSVKIKDMTDKLKGTENKVAVTEKDKETIRRIIEFLANESHLVLPNYEKKFRIHCDASDIGFGGILFQDHGVIMCVSKKFNETESRYSIVEKEMYAIVFTLNKSRNILLGNYVEIYTDNRNCMFKPSENKRLQRWQMLINEFNYKLEKIEGAENTLADYFSRCFTMQTEPNMMLQERQEAFKNINEFIEKSTELTAGIEDEKLGAYRNWKINKDGKYEIKEGMERKFILFLHEFMGHPGIVVMERNITRFYAGKSLRKEITFVIKNCINCIKNKKQCVRLKNVEITAKAAFSKLSMDIFGPFKKTDSMKIETSKDKLYFLLITDIYSRFSKIFLLTSITEDKIVNNIKKWCSTHGLPETIIADNGTQFTGRKLQRWADHEGIKIINTPMYNPASNGISERQNSLLAEVMRMYNGEDLKVIQNKIERRLNCNFKRSLGKSAFEKIYNYSFLDPLNRASPKERDNEKRQTEPVERERMFKKGDKVYIRNFKGSKLDNQFLGPYIVSNVGSKGRWLKVEGLKEWIHVRSCKRERQDVVYTT